MTMKLLSETTRLEQPSEFRRVFGPVALRKTVVNIRQIPSELKPRISTFQKREENYSFSRLLWLTTQMSVEPVKTICEIFHNILLLSHNTMIISTSSQMTQRNCLQFEDGSGCVCLCDQVSQLNSKINSKNNAGIISLCQSSHANQSIKFKIWQVWRSKS